MMSSAGTPTDVPAWCSNVARAGAVRVGEAVIVRADRALAESAERLVAALAEFAARPRLELIGPEPPAEVSDNELDELRATDLVISMWSTPFMLTPAASSVQLARMDALFQGGGRALTIPMASAELLEGELSIPVADLQQSAAELLGELSGASRLHLQGRAGTDLSVSVAGQAWQTDALPLQPGTFANFPSGEVFVVPQGDANGRLVADLTAPYIADGLLSEPLTLSVEAGRVVGIEGGREAHRLRELLAQAGPRAGEIAEIGIGLNPTAHPIGHVVVDEKVAGTAHVAIGRNAHMGGNNDASIHVDFVFASATIEVDHRPVDWPRRSSTPLT